jgi:ribosomal protein L11 methyltransferase
VRAPRRSWPALDVLLPPSVESAGLKDMILAALDDVEVGPSALDELDSSTIRAYFQDPVVRDAAALALRTQFAASGVVVRGVDIADEGWAERSQASLRAVRVGALTVAPPWDVPESDDGGIVIIEPSMGFGTAHHASTRLSLTALQALPGLGRRLSHVDVIDVGTGSGVLAIATLRLGARHVTAIDADRDAAASALANFDLNGCVNQITLIAADVRTLRLSPAPIVLANLTGPLLRSISERLLRLTAPGGALALSGFMTSEEDEVVGTFAPPARMLWRAEEDDWVAVVVGSALE